MVNWKVARPESWHLNVRLKKQVFGHPPTLGVVELGLFELGQGVIFFLPQFDHPPVSTDSVKNRYKKIAIYNVQNNN